MFLCTTLLSGGALRRQFTPPHRRSWSSPYTNPSFPQRHAAFDAQRWRAFAGGLFLLPEARGNRCTMCAMPRARCRLQHHVGCTASAEGTAGISRKVHSCLATQSATADRLWMQYPTAVMERPLHQHHSRCPKGLPHQMPMESALRMEVLLPNRMPAHAALPRCEPRRMAVSPLRTPQYPHQGT